MENYTWGEPHVVRLYLTKLNKDLSSLIRILPFKICQFFKNDVLDQYIVLICLELYNKWYIYIYIFTYFSQKGIIHLNHPPLFIKSVTKWWLFPNLPSQKKEIAIIKHIQKQIYYPLRIIYKEFLNILGRKYITFSKDEPLWKEPLSFRLQMWKYSLIDYTQHT